LSWCRHSVCGIFPDLRVGHGRRAGESIVCKSMKAKILFLSDLCEPLFGVPRNPGIIS
jgi:hypothetical protein